MVSKLATQLDIPTCAHQEGWTCWLPQAQAMPGCVPRENGRLSKPGGSLKISFRHLLNPLVYFSFFLVSLLMYLILSGETLKLFKLFSRLWVLHGFEVPRMVWSKKCWAAKLSKFIAIGGLLQTFYWSSERCILPLASTKTYWQTIPWQRCHSKPTKYLTGHWQRLAHVQSKTAVTKVLVHQAVTSFPKGIGVFHLTQQQQGCEVCAKTHLKPHSKISWQVSRQTIPVGYNSAPPRKKQNFSPWRYVAQPFHGCCTGHHWSSQPVECDPRLWFQWCPCRAGKTWSLAAIESRFQELQCHVSHLMRNVSLPGSNRMYTLVVYDFYQKSICWTSGSSDSSCSQGAWGIHQSRVLAPNGIVDDTILGRPTWLEFHTKSINKTYTVCIRKAGERSIGGMRRQQKEHSIWNK